MQNKSFVLSRAFLFGLLVTSASLANAATPLQLNHQPVSVLGALNSLTASPQHLELHETKRNLDSRHTLHVRIAQTYQGYPVFGAEGILHIPKSDAVKSSLHAAFSAAKTPGSFMNGVIYQNIQADLAGEQPTANNAAIATQHATELYAKKMSASSSPTNVVNQLMVYIDKTNQAHWAYKISFDVASSGGARSFPAKPVYIVDAKTLTVYTQWDDIKTLDENVLMGKEDVTGGGFGGNVKMGELTYDGLTGDLATLRMRRDATNAMCYLQNKDVTVKEYSTGKIVNFTCRKPDSDHNEIFWDKTLHTVNDGYSPDNDALFGGQVIKDMYNDWYHIPVLSKNDKPMMLNMIVHKDMDNAYWDGSAMTFGDGQDMFYPLTSLGVAAHEISHGFTEQHAGLEYYAQSGGMNEAFSDMAAQAAELYAYGKSSWQIGSEIFKQDGQALRYLDQPSKDCNGDKPGSWCSIDTFDQYYEGLDVHYSSGIYNRVFYLMGTSEGWDAKKAFDVMVQANSNYWTSNTTFAAGACGVIQATKDLAFDESVPKKAFDVVGVDYSDC